MTRHSCFLLLVMFAHGQAFAANGLSGRDPGSRLELREGWAIQSSARVSEKGDFISSTKFTPKDWYPTSVPSTVLAALVANQVYPDPYFGMNLRSIPGTSYPIGENFSNLPMPPDSPFRFSWWFRTEFRRPAEKKDKNLWLHFDGLNFRANIWLNGHRLAGSDKVAGAFRRFEFNITDEAKIGEPNVLAVEVFPPQANDLAITWVDVNPAPPDKNMGLWRDVYITASGPVALRHPHVISRLELPSLDTARLTVTAELNNASKLPVKGVLKGQIAKLEFAQNVELGAAESRVVVVTPERFPQLTISHPRVWWPAPLGPQNLYELKIEFETGGQVSDRQTVQFGIREVTSELNEKGYRVFKINGKDILIRGAGWWSDMLLRFSAQRQEAEIRYARDMNLNALRLDGKFENENFLNLCDRYGILLMPGWCCCDHWEKWKNWKAEDYKIAAESLKDQIRGFRNHPAVFDWLNGDDNPPPAEVEETYIKILKEANWPNPYQSSATGKPAMIAGRTGLKMTGPYEFIPPIYWFIDTTRGGAFGFITETSPGPAVPPVESLRKFLPEAHLWPIDEYWNFHAGGGAFQNLKVFTEALNARYGNASSLEDYVLKAQVMAYEGQRAMFEAYGRNKYTSTGVLQEMLNNAWPSMIWHLYDYYLRPGGGYFGTKKACEPLHVQYSYDDNSVVIVNSYNQDFKNMKVKAKVYNQDLSEKFFRETTLDVISDTSHRAFIIPDLLGLTTTYFLRLTLEDSTGKQVSSNFYWLSTKPDVLDWEKTTWYYTPTRSFADFTALQSLPKVELRVASRIEHQNDEDVIRVTVANPDRHLAFFVHLRTTKGRGGEEVLPILWQDNYFPLMPGEKREVGATLRMEDLQGANPVVDVDGWNVVPKSQ